MTVSHATRGARRYRYYVEARSQEDTSTPFEPIRLPAVEIETAATMALRLLLEDHRQVLEHLDDLAPSQTADALQRVPRLAHGLAGPAKGAAEIFRALVTKVTYRRDRLALQISTTGFRNTLGVERPSASWPDNAGGPAESFVVTAPLLYRRRGVQAKLIIGEGTHERPADISLQQAIARGRIWFEQLVTGERRSVAEISAEEGITGSKVAALLELAFLAPDLVDQIVQGLQPANLSTARLVRDEAIPPRWVDQRTKFSG